MPHFAMLLLKEEFRGAAEHKKCSQERTTGKEISRLHSVTPETVWLSFSSSSWVSISCSFLLFSCFGVTKLRFSEDTENFGGFILYVDSIFDEARWEDFNESCFPRLLEAT